MRNSLFCLSRVQKHARFFCVLEVRFSSSDPVVVVCSNKARRQFKFVSRESSSNPYFERVLGVRVGEVERIVGVWGMFPSF